ncbi:LacI family transcriptional regulator [Arcticibacter tournemirensis]|uniref:Substrate-binding domain-containing protein n=1 Tax=Arcticibacter tournemirensis TaxID=699437 RepID=A0A5M9H9G2_9SPHI|nr:substrate-binding domain-containing protein [Arcticibacter tournemirensis]KAA8482855.1 substrate-binding domain-containing protein [Arcticibacter tournemirensis]TQM49768.1 LacI family transcriptional regulator [Arcticibacter tournemirensis]
MTENNDTELVGVKEIARRANVSIATVDRVLHNRTGVSLKTKDKINAIIAELDYRPNIMARRLASKKVLRIAVLIPSVSSETDYWDAPLTGVSQAEAEIKAYGITVEKFLFDQNDKASFHAQARNVLKDYYDGVLLAPMFVEESKEFVEACQKRDIPYIFINSDVPGTNCLSYIGPDLYRSGYLGAHLANYLINNEDKILIVNISQEMDNHHHLLRKEEGFRAYFSENGKSMSIAKADIRRTDYPSVKKELTLALQAKDVRLIFVTNSRVSVVSRFLEESGIRDIVLIGYDFIKENIDYLKRQKIDFLICQKPQEQGYRGIMFLYNHLVHSASIDRTYYMPIDIITCENYQFYRN